jgi:hypothetical protein
MNALRFPTGHGTDHGAHAPLPSRCQRGAGVETWANLVDVAAQSDDGHERSAPVDELLRAEDEVSDR